MKKSELFIVAYKDGTLYLMANTDFRFGKSYHPVDTANKTNEKIIAKNGFTMTIYIGEEGSRYGVFVDGSVSKWMV